MSEPKDRQAFTERDIEALGKLYGRPVPESLKEKVMTGIRKETPAKPRNIAPPSASKTAAPKPKGREKDR